MSLSPPPHGRPATDDAATVIVVAVSDEILELVQSAEWRKAMADANLAVQIATTEALGRGLLTVYPRAPVLVDPILWELADDCALQGRTVIALGTSGPAFARVRRVRMPSGAQDFAELAGILTLKADLRRTSQALEKSGSVREAAAAAKRG